MQICSPRQHRAVGERQALKLLRERAVCFALFRCLDVAVRFQTQVHTAKLQIGTVTSREVLHSSHEIQQVSIVIIWAISLNRDVIFLCR